MAETPKGMLSLTYHLAYVESVRTQWLNSEFDACFAAFGITDPEQQNAIRAINDGMGVPDADVQNKLIDRWMALIGDDVRKGAANPLVLW